MNYINVLAVECIARPFCQTTGQRKVLVHVHVHVHVLYVQFSTF